jgi:hypothetical protein
MDSVGIGIEWGWPDQETDVKRLLGTKEFGKYLLALPRCPGLGRKIPGDGLSNAEKW